MSIHDNPGLALFSIPVVWLLAYIPGFMKNITIRYYVGFDNIVPRSNMERLPDPVLSARVKRMDGAHQNGLEAFPLWVSAVLAGTITGVDRTTMNSIALTFMVLRLAFLLVYVVQKANWQAYLRSFIWIASTGIALSLLLMAAVKAS